MRDENTRAAGLVIGFGILGFAVLAIDPPDRWPAAHSRADLPGHTLVFAGPETFTVPGPDLDPATAARAAAALEDARYHAAYAEGPAGRTGLWSGAHAPHLARSHALAACGPDCRVLAERRPRHAPEGSEEHRLILSHEMASRVGEAWPFVGSGGDALAVGGAGAWGTGHAGGRMDPFSRAFYRAVAECEARRRTEPTPQGLASRPCQAMGLRDAEIVDIRPEAPLYPAAYEVSHARLVGVPQVDLRVVDIDGLPVAGGPGNRLPDELYGVRATNGAGARGVVRAAGWPEAGAVLALGLCEAQRRFGDPPCAVVARRMPPRPLPDGMLGVTPELMDAYRTWERQGGAGAFAIGALGDWGSSHGLSTPEEARQRAADWCAYHARRGNRPHALRRAFIDQPPCRIVAERGR